MKRSPCSSASTARCSSGRSARGCRRGRDCNPLEAVADACRRIGVTEQSDYRWRKEYGGLKTDQARRMKELEKGNARLRRAVSHLTLDKLILQEASRGNF